MNKTLSKFADLKRRWLPRLRSSRALVIGTIEVKVEEVHFALAEIEAESAALIRADAIIEWMASYIGRMAPPANGISELNDHFLYMERRGAKPKKLDTSANHGRALDEPTREQRRI